MVKNLPTMKKTQVPSLGQKDPLKEQMTTHSIILAWEIPWIEELDRLQSMRWQKSWTQLSNLTAGKEPDPHLPGFLSSPLEFCGKI